MKSSRILKVDQVAIQGFLQRVQEALPGDVDLLAALITTIQHKDEKIEELRRLLRPRSERLRKLLDELAGIESEQEAGASGPGTDQSGPQTGSAAGSPGPAAPSGTPREKAKPRNHGRNGVERYTGARPQPVPLGHVKAGDRCPECGKGTLYQQHEHRVLRLIASPLISAIRYDCERLRCGTCGVVIKAPLPPEAGPEKCHPEVAAAVAITHYAAGMPFNRLAQLQAAFGVPLPASDQWDLVATFTQAAQPPYQALLRRAAQAPLLLVDDTRARIIEPGPQGRAAHTSCIIAREDNHEIVTYWTGYRIAGENLDQLLAKRAKDLNQPVQMCDALSHNLPKNFLVRLANCLTHGRRQFVNILPNFPEPCRWAIEQIAIVYHNDRLARDQNLDPDQRLRFHQQHSGPVMDGLRRWIEDNLSSGRCEEHSSLGRACKYFIRHWEPLTRFLRDPGVPLDNNACERGIKVYIRYRKNSLYYHTQHGAEVGDLVMGLFETCRRNHIDPLAYFRTLIVHRVLAKADPDRWLPWNYHDAIPVLDHAPP